MCAEREKRRGEGRGGEEVGDKSRKVVVRCYCKPLSLFLSPFSLARARWRLTTVPSKTVRGGEGFRLYAERRSRAADTLGATAFLFILSSMILPVMLCFCGYEEKKNG